MVDLIDRVQREMVLDRDRKCPARAQLEKTYGPVWSQAQMEDEFAVELMAYPFATVRRRSDGAAGTLMFRQSPRLYYSFQISRK